ncbi:acyltransferase domain-containing protein [Phthorimaea operculella]|nr:acyltransferase domain-containing protein [Phthorimaea operculella]
MAYDISWIIPRLRSPGRLWSCASSITVAVVGLFGKLIVELLNKTTVYNKQALQDAVRRRPPGVPLLTVSNHHSCFDDPGLWGVLETGTLVRRSVMRWSLAAHDICFTKAIHSAFFALGKCVPVVRGAGPAMDFCVERLTRGDWVHIFPEGRVNVDKEHIRFKWGVGRLVAECAASAPLILPVWHEGMDRVLPNQEPYLLKFRKRVFMNVGEPIQIHHLIDSLRASNASEEETRKAITDRIQDELLRLRERTHALIRRACGPAADGLLDNRTDVRVKPHADAADAAAGDHPAFADRNGKDKDL